MWKASGNGHPADLPPNMEPLCQQQLERRRSHSSISRMHSFPKSPRPSSLQEFSPSSSSSLSSHFLPSHPAFFNSTRDDINLPRRTDSGNTMDTSPRPYRSHSNRDPTRVRLMQSPLTRRKLSATKPGLNQCGHDSQLTLPTQLLIPDTRRTKTVPDFGNSIPMEKELRKQKEAPPASMPATTADDVEVDHVKKSRLSLFSPQQKVQQLAEVLLSSMAETSSEQLSTIIYQLLSTLHNEVGLSEDEHVSLSNMAGEVDLGMELEGERRRRRKRRKRISQLEPGWDYNLLDHKPMMISENVPTNGCGRMTFRAHFMCHSDSPPTRRESSLMKVQWKGTPCCLMNISY